MRNEVRIFVSGESLRFRLSRSLANKKHYLFPPSIEAKDCSSSHFFRLATAIEATPVRIASIRRTVLVQGPEEVTGNEIDMSLRKKTPEYGGGAFCIFRCPFVKPHLLRKHERRVFKFDR